MTATNSNRSIIAAAGRVPRFVVIGLVLFAGLVACSGSKPNTVTTKTVSGSLTAPAFFMSGAPQSTVAATADFLVGFGTATPGEQGPSAGESIDLATGETTPVSQPPGGPGFYVTDTASNNESVLVAGFRCIEEVLRDETCPAQVATYRFNPAASAWTELGLPAGLEGQPTATVSMLQSASENLSMAVFNSGDGSGAFIATLARDQWDRVGPAPAGRDRCATSTELLTMETITPGFGTDGVIGGLEVESTYAFFATDLATGESRALPVPPVSPKLGGTGIVMGCRGDAVVVASTPLAGTNDKTAEAVYQLGSSGQWETIAGVLTPPNVFLARAITGSAAGPAIIAVPYEPGVSEISTQSYTVVLDQAGEPQKLSGNTVDSDVFWRGLTNGLVIVGPHVAADENADSSARVPIRLEEIR